MHFPPSSGRLAHCALARLSLTLTQSTHDHYDADHRSALCGHATAWQGARHASLAYPAWHNTTTTDLPISLHLHCLLLTHCLWCMIWHQCFDAIHALGSASFLPYVCTTLHDTTSHPFHTARMSRDTVKTLSVIEPWWSSSSRLHETRASLRINQLYLWMMHARTVPQVPADNPHHCAAQPHLITLWSEVWPQGGRSSTSLGEWKVCFERNVISVTFRSQTALNWTEVGPGW